ncbi:MAG: hypothetical protein EA382_14375 [Spirochaetaceae bacterium]|nr:MAG: hypothetical protein EA382_14375 [Spirochaetaceae bacterium]
MTRLTYPQMLQLKRWNTPTVYNGWEAITRHDRSSAGKPVGEILAALDDAGRAFTEAATKQLGQKGEW